VSSEWQRGDESTYPSEADLISQVVKSADAILGVFEVMILDEAESGKA
jgi:hypothetical protein